MNPQNIAIECPECQTTYHPKRLGITIPDDPEKTVTLTVACPVCRRAFNASVVAEIRTEAPAQGWVDWLLRRTPMLPEAFEWTCVTHLREE